MKITIIRLAVLATVSMLGVSANAADYETAANYEFVNASEDRVWRLNKNTGEIAVCSLQGDHLLCTSSETAMSAPKMTYADYQQEQTVLATQREERLAERRRAQHKMLEKVFNAVAEMAGAGVGGNGQ